jgi:hypothetical protein
MPSLVVSCVTIQNMLTGYTAYITVSQTTTTTRTRWRSWALRVYPHEDRPHLARGAPPSPKEMSTSIVCEPLRFLTTARLPVTRERMRFVVSKAIPLPSLWSLSGSPRRQFVPLLGKISAAEIQISRELKGAVRAADVLMTTPSRACKGRGSGPCGVSGARPI